MKFHTSSVSAKPEEHSGLWAATHSLTKPVYLATQRPMPRWVGWLLIALPSLSILGTWLVGRLPLFQFVAIILLALAVWDWHRFFDRSRTMWTLFSLAAGMVFSATISIIVSRPPGDSLLSAAASMIITVALAFALVQLYRNEQTVLTVVRGWMYAIALLAGITFIQGVSAGLPALTGPFPSPGYLAGSMLAGIVLMPVGFSLETDRRLKWTYPVIAIAATWVTWTTHRSIAFALALAVLLVWLALYHWIVALIITAVTAVAAVVIAVFRPVNLPLRWTDVGMEPPLDAAIHGHLLGIAWRILEGSHFLGVGPGGLSAHWPEGYGNYSGPYSAFLEIASAYGLAITVALVLGLIGILVWCASRLWTTRRLKLTSPERAPALWLALMILSLPLATSIQAEWLGFPLSTLGLASLALLARHIEPPQGRALVWPAEAHLTEEAQPPAKD